MKKQFVLLLCLFIFFACLGHTQSTIRFQKIHKILKFDSQQYRNILVTDSCYWVTGWGIDTLYPYLWAAFVSKISLEGEILIRNELRDSHKKYGWPIGIFVYDNIISSAYFDAYDSIRIVNYDISKDSIYESLSWGTVNKSVRYIYSPSYRVDENGNQFICAVNEGDTVKLDSEIQFIKYNKDHEIVFLKRFYKSNMFYDIIDNTVDDNGNLLLFGKIYLPHYKLNDDNSYRNLILKLDSNGTIIKWITSDRFTGGIYDLIKDDAGNYLCGSCIPFHGKGNLVGHPAIIKMDSLGKTIWTIIPDSSELYSGAWLFYSNMRKIIQTDRNNYTSLGGIVYRDTFSVTNPGPEFRIILLHFNTDGIVNWQRIFRLAEGGEVSDEYDMKRTDDGGYIISGLGSGFGEKFKDGLACILIKTDSCGCVVPNCQKIVNNSDIESGKEKSFVIYPNPIIGDQLFMLSRITSKQNFNWSIIDLQGRVMISNELKVDQGVQYLIPIPETIPNGDYIFSIGNGTFEQDEKIVIKR